MDNEALTLPKIEACVERCFYAALLNLEYTERLRGFHFEGLRELLERLGAVRQSVQSGSNTYQYYWAGNQKEKEMKPSFLKNVAVHMCDSGNGFSVYKGFTVAGIVEKRITGDPTTSHDARRPEDYEKFADEYSKDPGSELGDHADVLGKATTCSIAFLNASIELAQRHYYKESRGQFANLAPVTVPTAFKRTA